MSLTLALVITGYSFTETVGIGSPNDPLAWTVNAGDIRVRIEEKLVGFAEVGYRTANHPLQGKL